MRLRNIFAAALAMVSCVVCTKAQDRIHLLDSRKVIEAKVIEIGEIDLLYKLYNNLDGPDYRISLSRIASIDFENGTREVFAGEQGVAGPYVKGYLDGYDDGLLDYRWGNYYLGDRRLRRQELTDYIGYSLYGEKYRKANNRYYWGVALTGIGVFILAGTVTDQIYQSRFNNNPAFQDKFFKDNQDNGAIGHILGYAAGVACLGSGIPLWIKADRTLNEIADDYNRNYGRRNLGYTSSVTAGPTRSGVGLALNF